MQKIKDMTGLVFGRLTVTARSSNTRHGKTQWCCVCECGNQVIAIAGNLIQGRTASCGCLQRDMATKTHSKGQRKKNPLYTIWKDMKKRCENPSCIGYQWYGGKGIKVCERWHSSFDNFIADMGERPTDENGVAYHIDRKDSDKDYSPDNCRWITRAENSRLAVIKRMENKLKNCK